MPARDRPLLDRPDRLAGLPVEDVGERLFRRLNEDRNAPSVDRHIEQARSDRVVAVPDVVMHRLEVPFSFARPRIQRQDARRKQVGARMEAAPIIVGRRIRHHVDEPAFRVGRHRRPRRNIPGPLPGIVLPGVEAELALRLRNHVELPEVLSAPGIVGEDVTRHVLIACLAVALLVRVADDHDAVDDDRRRRVRDVANARREAVGRVILVP